MSSEFIGEYKESDTTIKFRAKSFYILLNLEEYRKNKRLKEAHADLVYIKEKGGIYEVTIVELKGKLLNVKKLVGKFIKNKVEIENFVKNCLGLNKSLRFVCYLVYSNALDTHLTLSKLDPLKRKLERHHIECRFKQSGETI